MSIIIKMRGLPIEANSVDVRLYFLGLNIPDGGVHIVGGEDGIVFVEFANDEDARQAMARGLGTIKNSTVNLLLSSRTEMQSVIDSIRQKHQHFVQQTQHQQPQQQPQLLLPPQPANDPSANVHQPWYNAQQVPLLPAWMHQQPTVTTAATQIQTSLLNSSSTMQNLIPGQLDQQLLLHQQQQVLQQQQQDQQIQQLHQQQQQLQQQQQQQQQQQPKDSRARAKGMRGGDDRLFANKRCVLAASNIPYRATSKDIIEFLADFNITEDNIRRRYNQKNQPTADAKIAFPNPDAAMKAMKLMNKKTLCGRPVFLKPV